MAAVDYLALVVACSFLVDSIEFVEEERLNYGTNHVGRAIASTIIAFSHGRDCFPKYPPVLTAQIIDMCRRHGNRIFRNTSEFLTYQPGLVIQAYFAGLASSFPDNFDLYLWNYVREIAETGIIDINNEYWSNELFQFTRLTNELDSLAKAQLEKPDENRAAKIATLTDIIKTLWPEQFSEAVSSHEISVDTLRITVDNTVESDDDRDEAKPVAASDAMNRVDSFDTGPYIRRTVTAMIAERRKTFAARQEKLEQPQEPAPNGMPDNNTP